VLLAPEPLHLGVPRNLLQVVHLWWVHPAVVLPVGRVERDRCQLIFDGIEDVTELIVSFVEVRGGRSGAQPAEKLREPLGPRRLLTIPRIEPSLSKLSVNITGM
jgi:hypothetical protein